MYIRLASFTDGKNIHSGKHSKCIFELMLLLTDSIFKYLIREIRWFVLFGGYERAQAYITKLYGMFLHSTIKDEKLREKLRPNFKLGCKRILISDEFHPYMMFLSKNRNFPRRVWEQYPFLKLPQF